MWQCCACHPISLLWLPRAAWVDCMLYHAWAECTLICVSALVTLLRGGGSPAFFFLRRPCRVLCAGLRDIRQGCPKTSPGVSTTVPLSPSFTCPFGPARPPPLPFSSLTVIQKSCLDFLDVLPGFPGIFKGFRENVCWKLFSVYLFLKPGFSAAAGHCGGSLAGRRPLARRRHSRAASWIDAYRGSKVRSCVQAYF